MTPTVRARFSGQRHPYLLALVVLIALAVINAILQPTFLRAGVVVSNIAAFLPMALVAAGQTYVILASDIDLSAGAIVSLVNVVVVTIIDGMGGSATSIALGLATGVAVGLAAGAVNGYCVGVLRLQPIVTTFATGIVFSGIALWVLPEAGKQVPPALYTAYAGGFVGVPTVVWILIGTALFANLIARTRYYQALRATGGNMQAAYQTGLPVARVRIGAYVCSGFFAAAAGLALVGETASGDPLIGGALTLSSVTAVVLGGTALSGCIGGVTGSQPRRRHRPRVPVRRPAGGDRHRRVPACGLAAARALRPGAAGAGPRSGRQRLPPRRDRGRAGRRRRAPRRRADRHPGAGVADRRLARRRPRHALRRGRRGAARARAHRDRARGARGPAPLPGTGGGGARRAGPARLPAGLSGHASTAGTPWAAELLDGIHVFAAGVWSGGLALLAVALGAGLARLDPEPRRPFLRGAVKRFTRLAVGAVAVLVATGTIAGLRELDAVSELVDTRYGQVLTLKVLVVATALGIALLSRRAGPSFLRDVRAEAALLAVAIVLTAALTGLAPGANAAPPRRSRSSSRSGRTRSRSTSPRRAPAPPTRCTSSSRTPSASPRSTCATRGSSWGSRPPGSRTWRCP